VPIDLIRRAEAAAAPSADEAAALDRHGAFPEAAIDRLRAGGFLAAPLPADLGGAGLCEPERVGALCAILAAVGRGSLAVGRLYEGHVNALALVLRYGSDAARDRLARDTRDGHLFGVWNTEPEPGGLVLAEGALRGAKSFASGAGHVTRPLVTARLADGRRQMLVVPLALGERADLADWRAQGMRATATGRVDFTGLAAAEAVPVGAADDYARQPVFFGGAWRFLAVQLGGIEAVVEAHRAHMRSTGRGADPHQQARLGRALIAAESCRLLVRRAAEAVAAERAGAERIVAYVNLARAAVEQAGLDVLALAQRSVGLAGFHEDHPLERLSRDLATYLRQPAPDHALTSAAAHALAEEAALPALWAGLESDER
jgi:alkylation response protein AidB-like acyl-CoA dehydrogenase